MRELGEKVAALKAILIELVSHESALKVPDICRAIGLDEGETSEAMRSKARYVERRLSGQPAEVVFTAAERYLLESRDYYLAEALAKAKEVGSPVVSEHTRRRIVLYFDKHPLSTELEEMEVYRRAWPTTKMRTTGQPHGDADWTMDDELHKAMFIDQSWSTREALEALNIHTCSQQQFFHFVETVCSPVVQSEKAQDDIVMVFNQLLVGEGFKLHAERRASGSRVYRVKPTAVGSPSDTVISDVLMAFDPDRIHERWTEALERRSTNPEGAITLARTLLEDVSKWILTEANEPYTDKDDLPKLYSKLAKTLNLAPDAHSEQVFKQILGSCQQIVEQLGALRNRISDAHSPGPKRVRPKPRHAELAVNLSGTMATFLVSTWMEMKERKDTAPEK